MAAIMSFMIICGIIRKIEINVIFNFDDEQFGLLLSPSIAKCDDLCYCNTWNLSIHMIFNVSEEIFYY